MTCSGTKDQRLKKTWYCNRKLLLGDMVLHFKYVLLKPCQTVIDIVGISLHWVSQIGISTQTHFFLCT